MDLLKLFFRTVPTRLEGVGVETVVVWTLPECARVLQERPHFRLIVLRVDPDDHELRAVIRAVVAACPEATLAVQNALPGINAAA